MAFVRLCSKMKRLIGLSLVVSMLVSSTAVANAKPLTPETVHNRIVKLGAGNWVWIQESNGITLHGVVTNIGLNAFGLQRYNDPASVTTIAYSAVVSMRTPISGKTALAIVGVFMGAAVGGAFALHHEYEIHKNDVPPTPTLP